jgi:hypothetical protein
MKADLHLKIWQGYLHTVAEFSEHIEDIKLE